MDDIDVGAADSGLRLWRAKEALHQAELRLKAQADSLAGFVSRASAILGWVVAIGCLVAAGVLQSPETGRVLASVFMAIPLASAALCCALVMRPRAWGELGYAPATLLDSDLGSELEEIEAMALGHLRGIDANNCALASIATTMRAAYWLFAAAPVAGTAALVITRILASAPG